jgi:hypothetical protein
MKQAGYAGSSIMLAPPPGGGQGEPNIHPQG